MEKVEKVERVTHRSLKVLRLCGIKRPRFRGRRKMAQKTCAKAKNTQHSQPTKNPQKKPQNRQKNEKEISSVRRKNIYNIYIIYNILLLFTFFFSSPLLFGDMRLLQESSQQNESLLSRVSQTVKLLRVGRTFASVHRFFATFFLHCCIFLQHSRESFTYAQKFYTSSFASAKLSRV